jgi:hypothetical protein
MCRYAQVTYCPPLGCHAGRRVNITEYRPMSRCPGSVPSCQSYVLSPVELAGLVYIRMYCSQAQQPSILDTCMYCWPLHACPSVCVRRFPTILATDYWLLATDSEAACNCCYRLTGEHYRGVTLTVPD